MKLPILIIIFLVITISPICTYTQGIIKGSVTDSLTSDKLKGVEIIFTGTSFHAVSNTDGEFILSGIPAGEYILQTSCRGYKPKKFLITIKSDEIQKLNIRLLPDSKNGIQRISAAQAGYQDEENNLQVTSNSVINVISGKSLQELPDENINVSLSRLPGVYILYKPAFFSPKYTDDYGRIMPPTDDLFYADESFPAVRLRGLDSRYYNITIDGIRIPSTSARDRSIDLGIFSERGLNNIELYKTITSDEDADATGGVINLVSGKASDKRIIKGELSGNYNRFEKSTDQYNLFASYSDRFLNNLFGLKINTDVEKRILSNEYQVNNSLFYLTGGYNFTYTNAFKERFGIDVLIDYDTPDGGSIRFHNVFNKMNTDYFDNSVDSSKTSLNKLIFKDREFEKKIFLSAIKGCNYLYGFDIDWNVSFSESKSDIPVNYSMYFMKDNFPDIQYNLDHSTDSPSRNYSKGKTVSVNIKKSYNLTGEISGELKFGGRYRGNSSSFYEDLQIQNSDLSGKNQYRKLIDGTLAIKDFTGSRFDGLLGQSKDKILLSYFQDNTTNRRSLFDKYTLPLINKDAMRLWRKLTEDEYYLNDGPDINSYDITENVLACYVIHNLDFGGWIKFVTGIRIESESNDYSGYTFPDIINSLTYLYNNLPKKTDTYHYRKTTLLPNYQMLLHPINFFKLRFAAYKTLIRPDYISRLPRAASIDVFKDGYLLLGNPDLKNADVWNYEVQTQFDGNYIGQFSINAFYKNIKGMQQKTDEIPIAVSKGSNAIDLLGINWKSLNIDFPFKNKNYFFYSYYNSSKPTHIWGFEIEHQINFWYLPEYLNNITLNYNISFMGSESWEFSIKQLYLDQKIPVTNRQKLDDVPALIANVILGYDIKGLSVRMSYFYQDVYTIFNEYKNTQVKQNKNSRLDIAVRQQLLKNISVILNLNNITNTKEESIFREIPTGIWKTLQAYRYGFNFNFGVSIEL